MSAHDPDNEPRTVLTHQQVAEIAFEAAGAASVPFMRDHPDYVMPTEEISEGVERVLADFGMSPNESAESWRSRQAARHADAMEDAHDAMGRRLL